MSQDDAGIDLETSLGYLLKEAASALRAAMEDVLRPLDMTITHYSCLELLAQRPGSSNSDLARGAFVTRQSMNVLLQTLERDGFVTRPSEAPVGKVLPTKLTPRGRRSLEQATAAVRSVEVRMLSGLSDADQAAALRILRSMVSSLRAGPTADPDGTDPDADATDPDAADVDAADADAGSAVADRGGESARGA
jgi:DNA-binding MarR family transcriptional regulator